MTKWSPPEDRCRCGNAIRWLDRYCNNCAEREADRVFSLWIRKRDGRCVVPGCRSRRSLECAHILTRAHRRIRWAAENAVALCGGQDGHHAYFTRAPAVWGDFIQETFPGRMVELHHLSFNGPKADVGEIIRRYGRKVA